MVHEAGREQDRRVTVSVDDTIVWQADLGPAGCTKLRAALLEIGGAATVPAEPSETADVRIPASLANVGVDSYLLAAWWLSPNTRLAGRTPAEFFRATNDNGTLVQLLLDWRSAQLAL